ADTFCTHVRRKQCVREREGAPTQTHTAVLLSLLGGYFVSYDMFVMRAVVAAALVLLGVVDAFVSPSAFVRATGSSRECTSATARAAGAMRSRPTMNVIDIGSFAELDKLTSDNKDKLVVVDYSTTWCGPCKMILPKFEQLAEQYSDAVFVKVIGDSTNDASQLMKREGVRSVPSFHFWKDGKKVEKVNGANEEALEQTLRDFH
ncbi:unnamed protein product, partial [Ectocarpus sp. 6 AP-2014]